ncbi:MAG: tetratricopeptide repeat protein [Candidatus Zixiibacteriota bacterium]
MPQLFEIDDRIEKCQRLLDGDPNSQIFAALAEAYRKRGDLDKAFRVCQNGLKIHPSYGSAHLVMAKINLDRGLYDWAEIEAQKASELEGRTRAVELLLSEIYIYKGEFNSAIRLLKKLHEGDPGNPQIEKLLEIARRLPEEQARVLGQEQKKSFAGAMPVPTASESQPLRTALSTNEVLDEAMKIPGVDGAMVVNREGLAAETRWQADLDPVACSATMGTISSWLDQELVKAEFGAVANLLVETARHTFYIIRIPVGIFLFVANEQVNLGTFRMRIESLVARHQ